jgi:hypothetical protein
MSSDILRLDYVAKKTMTLFRSTSTTLVERQQIFASSQVPRFVVYRAELTPPHDLDLIGPLPETGRNGTIRMGVFSDITNSQSRHHARVTRSNLNGVASPIDSSPFASGLAPTTTTPLSQVERPHSTVAKVNVTAHLRKHIPSDQIYGYLCCPLYKECQR